MTQGGKIYIIEGKTDGIVCIFLGSGFPDMLNTS
jgi:hypothetical protein